LEGVGSHTDEAAAVDRAETTSRSHLVCEHRLMSSQDDPEARIRELERSLGEHTSELTRSSSEMGSGGYGPGYVNAPPSPPYTAPPQPPYTVPQSPYPLPPSSFGGSYPPVQVGSSGTGRGWLMFAVMGAVLVGIVAGVVIFVSNVFSSVNSVIGTFGPNPTASGGGGPFGMPSGGNHAPAPTDASTVPVAPPGGDVNVAGVGDSKTIACNDSLVNVSGVSNTVVLTGQCRSVTVSGVKNTITVDATAIISASGFENRVTFLSGTPEIQNSGDSNIVERG
jgi:hypothetical protein